MANNKSGYAPPFSHNGASFAFQPLKKWSKFHVAESLRALGNYPDDNLKQDEKNTLFESYAANFVSNDIDGSKLVDLTCSKLKHELGVHFMEHRRKIFDWIEHLMVASSTDQGNVSRSASFSASSSSKGSAAANAALEAQLSFMRKQQYSQAKTVQTLHHSVHSIKMDFRILAKQCQEQLLQAEAATEQSLNQMAQTMTQLVTQNEKLEFDNRDLYNQVVDLKGSIRVICRIRPLLPSDEDYDQGTITFCPNSTTVHVDQWKAIPQSHRNGNTNHNLKPFKFDRVFNGSACSEDVFLETQPLVRSVMDGFNVCIFAYGQTGSGKTHTMMGTPTQPGIIVKALDTLFDLKRDREGDGARYSISMEMREIYNENMRDLLAEDHGPSTSGSNGKDKPGDSRRPSVFSSAEMKKRQVENTQDVLDLIAQGEQSRSVGATALNEHSSRSHCITMVAINGRYSTGEQVQGKLQLIDLAGSERVARSEAVGDRLKEAQHINKSLSALGDVIAALQEKRSHVPFRNSVLTRHLQESLSGSSKVVMFAHINPSIASTSESISTLTFAQRVASVQLGRARQNVETGELIEAREELPRMRDSLDRMSATLASKDAELDEARAQIRRMEESLREANAHKHSNPEHTPPSTPPRPHHSPVDPGVAQHLAAVTSERDQLRREASNLREQLRITLKELGDRRRCDSAHSTPAASPRPVHPTSKPTTPRSPSTQKAPMSARAEEAAAATTPPAARGPEAEPGSRAEAPGEPSGSTSPRGRPGRGSTRPAWSSTLHSPSSADRRGSLDRFDSTSSMVTPSTARTEGDSARTPTSAHSTGGRTTHTEVQAKVSTRRASLGAPRPASATSFRGRAADQGVALDSSGSKERARSASTQPAQRAPRPSTATRTLSSIMDRARDATGLGSRKKPGSAFDRSSPAPTRPASASSSYSKIVEGAKLHGEKRWI